MRRCCRAAPSARVFWVPVTMALAIAAVGCGGGGSKRPPDGSAGGTGGSGGGSSGGSGGNVSVDGSTVDTPPSSGGSGGTTPTDATSDPGSSSDLGLPPPDAATDLPAGETAAMCAACTDYAPTQTLGNVSNAALNALSGMAVSRKNPNVLYVHNDRNRAEFFAVSQTGALLSTITLGGVTVLDIEDMAVGPCPAGSCVYLADIGNNIAARPSFLILRLPEPTVAPGSPATQSATAERLVYTYPDGAHNAESLLVDPRTSNLYVITKVAAGQPSAVYRLPTTFGGAAAGMATKVADLTVPAAADTPATAGDAHPCGTGFLLRTNNTLYEFRIPAGTPFENAFRATPVVVPTAPEQQGEAVAYSPDGRSYFTTSEGDNPPIHRTACR